ncbi:major facilitator superfamily domain-containing protein [Aspergillus undulatus]|uniref:major facilitator superfamily domain-containing protein n=1 Tax=Aspergillus undulatus TaxID=1810928 RepID=UPI003CCDAB5A
MFRFGRKGKPHAPWDRGWRSSDGFIIGTLSLAVFTDEMLFAFMVPLLPTILEDRIGLDVSLTQRCTSVFLAEGALVTVLSSPIFGSIADTVRSKKVLLLVLLVLTFVSLVCLSLTTTLIWLYLGRFFQCIVSNGLWIVGMATLAENVGAEHMGKITGLTSALTAAGTIAGPVLAGLLFGIGGYWVAWAGAAAFLVVDTTMRLLMVEKGSTAGLETSDEAEDDPLIAGSLSSDYRDQRQGLQGWYFYATLLRQPRFTTGLLIYYVFALLIACFESTLAVHVRNVFDWGALPAGLLLASIQGPRILLAPSVGWLKDRIGSRVPTALGLFSLIPFLLPLGIPGDRRFPWINEEQGKIIYAFAMGMLGCLMCLLNGVGMMEAAETIDDLSSSHPGIFGRLGGYSRAIAMTSMVWAAGLFTGPILAGFLVERFGYFELQCFLAVACFITGLLAFLFLARH